MEARAALLAAAGKRTWEISPAWSALIVIIDEYAELADEAPDAMSDTDSIAQLGRAVTVTLIAATQRPTQKAMGQGAVRSQMDLRICFRVREQRDVDLVLGQGMLRAGWKRTKLYRHLREHAEAGRAIRVSGGRWRARTPEEPHRERSSRGPSRPEPRARVCT